MNKEYIEALLREEEMVNIISKLRTQFSRQITEFYFFRTFFEALNMVGINGTTTKSHCPYDGGIKTDHYIILSEKNNKLNNQYNNDKLLEDLKNYNATQEGLGMIKSAHKLIDIFISLLE